MKMGIPKTQFTNYDYSKSYGKVIKIHNVKFKICPIMSDS